ncbi:MAG: PEP-CTERM sorting domain-containing protein [Akkermansiaceae bacterium]|nr:PEP-CTERM sorting domain-containing protein [Akkermansiaceae bacterium]
MKTKITIGLATLIPLTLINSASAALVAGFDQRYVGSGFGATSAGTWDDAVGSADAVANIPASFTATTTPNGSDAVANSTAASFLNFTRANSLGGTTGMLTIQAVIRIDGTVDDRSGPFALAQTSGWGGLYMGAQTDGVNNIRAGNIGNSGNNTTVLRIDNGGSAVTTGTWGIYTLVVDGTQNTNPQLTASFALLSDLSNVFSLTTSSTALATGTNLGLGTGGVLFGGERGTTDANNTTGGWNGAIADLVVYDSALNSSQISANNAEFKTLYQVPEPSSALLIGLGALGLLMRRRRTA